MCLDEVEALVDVLFCEALEEVVVFVVGLHATVATCLKSKGLDLEATHLLQHVLDGLLGILGIGLPGNGMNFSMTKGGDELSLNLIREDDVLQEEVLPIRKRKNNKLKTI